MRFQLLSLVGAGLFMLSCSKQPSTSETNERIKTLEAENARLKVAPQTPLPQQTESLTRDKATQLLNQVAGPSLASPHIYELGFDGNRLGQMEKAGVVLQATRSSYGTGYYLTGKTVAMLNGLVDSDAPVDRLAFPNCSVHLTRPIGERVQGVTGIAPGPSPNLCTVEYTTEYQLPKEAQSLVQFFYSGRQANATLQKFDDGWRVVNY